MTLQLGRQKQAEEAFKAANAMNSSSGIVYTNLGALARQNGDAVAAATFYGKATGGSELSYNKGVLSIVQGNYSECHLANGNSDNSQFGTGKNPE